MCKQWDIRWETNDKLLSVRADHDHIRIDLPSRGEVYHGKNNWGEARLSRKPVSIYD